MQAGLLKEWINIEREVDVPQDKFGGITKEWETVCRKRARVQFKTGNLEEENRENVHTEIITITIRYQSGIDRNMRIVWNGEKYRILSANRDRAQMALVFKCELINE